MYLRQATSSTNVVSNHNCVQALNHELNNVKNELEKYRNDVDFYKNETFTLQEFIRVSRANSLTTSYTSEDLENDEILRYENNYTNKELDD
ncbi:unnamed protein product [Rotaria sp. Silwood1]|nr:unnamed protein product [Rotaria sp. Silwood1]